MANTPPKGPSSPGAKPPSAPAEKPASRPAQGRLNTPPPAAARKSSGQIPAHGASGGTVPPPPPASRGTSTAAAAPGQPARRVIVSTKPQGLPIKMKVVLAMSGLTIAIVVVIFLIVQAIGRSSLEATVEQSGRANLQQAEALYENYRNTVSDTGMIAYFSQGNTRTKFDTYWRGLHKEWPKVRTGATIQFPWFNTQIPACRSFANYQQLINDRIWVVIASELKTVGDQGQLAALTDDQRGQIIGPQAWADLKKLAPGAVLPEPSTPRVVNDEAMRTFKDYFSDLQTAYQVKGKPWEDLRTKLANETMNSLIADTRGGLRRVIYTEYRKDFSGTLDALTNADDSQIRLIQFEIKVGMLPGFEPREMSLVSHAKTDKKPDLSQSSAKRTAGDIEIDPAATAFEEPAFSFSRDQRSGDTVTLYLDRKYINARQSNLVLTLLGVSVVAILVAVGMAFFVGGNITRPLQVLMQDIQIISGGNFDHRPLAQSGDEVGIVSRLLGDMAAGLKQAQEVWAENQSRKHDLDIAKEIQENLLPKHVPRIAGYDVSAYYSPSKEVGGDYYDFFLVDKTHLGMICADVSGKGIPGSMVMMMTKALVSYEAESNLSPRDIFCKVNRTLAKDIKRGMFVTAFYMLLDIPTARLTVASAGHNPLLMYRASTKQCVEINPGGIALGFDKDGRLFERNMKEETIQLQRGDRVVIYTDGVTEAMSPDGQEFSSERLIQITTQAANAPSSQYLTTLVNALQAHAQSDDQHDDITIVTVKVG
ncbi:MAG: hypothetical protein HPKKFMNG_02201 [Planctomycetes bacterium]|nr:hypothetical protein [Planctomycetota bacterium]